MADSPLILPPPKTPIVGKQSIILPADAIIGHGLITAETVAQELRERLANRVTHLRNRSEIEILDYARNVLAEFEPMIAEALLATDLAAWIAGFDRVARGLPDFAFGHTASMRDGFFPPPPPRFTLPFIEDEPEPIIHFPLIERARDSLLQRKILTPEQYRAASTESRNRSFTVAGQMTEKTLESIRDVLAENVQQGYSYADFKQRMAEKIDTSAIGPGHMENVYRTNVQAAYADGHETLASNPVVASVFPYQAYLPIHDSRARHTHLELGSLGLSGTGVYRRDDPFWDWFTPPWDYQCRCGVNLLTIDAAARKGVKEAQEWLRTGVPPANPEWRLQFIPFRPRAGFGGARRRAVAA